MSHSEQEFALPPFPSFPCAARYVAVGPVADAVARVARSLAAREAVCLMIGPPGTGKSLACGVLAEQFAETREVVLVGDTTLSDEAALYRELLRRLGETTAGSPSGDWEWMLKERLTDGSTDREGAVVIIDEAGGLNRDVLEAIRRLTNLMRDGQPAVSVVLCGNNRLDETLADPALDGLVQRVSARCYLHPLNADEVRAYVQGTITDCGGVVEETVTDDALASLFHATSGVPRLINQLMTEAIDVAAEMGQSLIDATTISRAWASLQQLPGPMIDEPEMEKPESTVEFGTLDSPLTEMPDVDPSFAATPNQPSAAESGGGNLFGDFEQEECIEIGMAPFAAARLGAITTIDASAAAVEAAIMPIDNAGAVEPDSDQADRFGESENTPMPSVLWYDEADLSADGDESAEEAFDDDSDLLWISEDVDVDRRSAAAHGSHLHRVDPGETSDARQLTVNYRQMLEKMRKGG